MYDATPTQLSQKTKQQLALMVAKDGESSWLVHVLLDIGTCIIALHSWSQAQTWGKMLTSDSKSDWAGWEAGIQVQAWWLLIAASPHLSAIIWR